MLENFVEIFFYGRGPKAIQKHAVPLDTACFWIEDPSRNRLALNGISAINITRFFEKNEKNIFFNFFFPLNFFLVLKSSETYAKKILSSALFDGGGEGGEA